MKLYLTKTWIRAIGRKKLAKMYPGIEIVEVSAIYTPVRRTAKR